MAKRKGQKWFIGGITNDKERELDVALSMLPEGKNLQMTSFVDGINANRIAMDYRMEKTSPLSIEYESKNGTKDMNEVEAIHNDIPEQQYRS